MTVGKTDLADLSQHNVCEYFCLSVSNECLRAYAFRSYVARKKVDNSYRINLEVDIQVPVEGFWKQTHAFGTRGMHST